MLVAFALLAAIAALSCTPDPDSTGLAPSKTTDVGVNDHSTSAPTAPSFTLFVTNTPDNRLEIFRIEPHRLVHTGFHPMKGPMTTQSLRGMLHSGPMHGCGDRTRAATSCRTWTIR
jgi:hypothetical protein